MNLANCKLLSIHLKSHFISFFILVFASFYFITSSGCSSSSNTGLSGNFTAYSYTGAGSNTKWRMVLNSNGAFAAIESNSSTSVLGTYTRDASGFVKISITSGAGASAPTTFPLNLVGIELPGVAYVMQPILTSENAMITAVLSGNCPGNSLSHNYVFTQFNASDDLTSAAKGFFGTLTYAQDSGATNTPTYFTLNSGFPAASAGTASMAGICQNGVSTFSGALDFVMSSGSFIKFSGSDNSGLLTLPQQAVTLLTNLNSTFAGLVFDGSNNTVFPVQGTLAATGTSAPLVLSNVNTTDLVTVTTPYKTLTFGSVDTPSVGFVQGTIGGTNIACTANISFVGKNSLVCVGQNPSGATKPVVIILASH